MATTLEQLLDKYVYTQLQDADNKIRWTRDELTRYVNLALIDLVSRRPEAGVVTEDDYPLQVGSLQPLPETVVRLKEIVANTGTQPLTFVGAVRANGMVVDLVFGAVSVTATFPTTAFSVAVNGVDNPITTSLTTAATLSLALTNPIYADDAVTVSFDDDLGSLTSADGRDLTDQVDVPVENNSTLILIRYAVATRVMPTAATVVSRNGAATGVVALPIAAVTKQALATQVEVAALALPSPQSAVAEVASCALAVGTTEATATEVNATAATASTTTAVATEVLPHAVAAVSPAGGVTEMHVYAIVVNAA